MPTGIGPGWVSVILWVPLHQSEDAYVCDRKSPFCLFSPVVVLFDSKMYWLMMKIFWFLLLPFYSRPHRSQRMPRHRVRLRIRLPISASLVISCVTVDAASLTGFGTKSSHPHLTTPSCSGLLRLPWTTFRKCDCAPDGMVWIFIPGEDKLWGQNSSRY